MADRTKDALLKAPPQSLEAERALLGAVIIKPDTIHDIIDIANGAVFYSNKHKIIWDALFELSNKNEPIDLLSLSNLLSEKVTLNPSAVRHISANSSAPCRRLQTSGITPTSSTRKR